MSLTKCDKDDTANFKAKLALLLCQALNFEMATKPWKARAARLPVPESLPLAPWHIPLMAAYSLRT